MSHQNTNVKTQAMSFIHAFGSQRNYELKRCAKYCSKRKNMLHAYVAFIKIFMWHAQACFILKLGKQFRSVEYYLH